jgi:predicted amidohydrolase
VENEGLAFVVPHPADRSWVTALFRLALVQMKVVGGHKEQNLAHADAMIGRAADEGADVVVLPEAMSLGWTYPAGRAEADPVPDGRTCTVLRDVARRHGRYVCSGLVERAGDRVYNAAVLIGPNGEVLLLHRKVNELEIARAATTRETASAWLTRPWAPSAS